MWAIYQHRIDEIYDRIAKPAHKNIEHGGGAWWGWHLWLSQPTKPDLADQIKSYQLKDHNHTSPYLPIHTFYNLGFWVVIHRSIKKVYIYTYPHGVAIDEVFVTHSTPRRCERPLHGHHTTDRFVGLQKKRLDRRFHPHLWQGCLSLYDHTGVRIYQMLRAASGVWRSVGGKTKNKMQTWDKGATLIS